MGRRKPNYTLVSTDDKNDPLIEEFEIFEALKIRMRGITVDDQRFKLLKDGRPVTFDWSEPELIIGGVAVAPATRKKPGRKKKPAAPTSTNGSSGTRFDADTLEPAPAPAQHQPDVEA